MLRSAPKETQALIGFAVAIAVIAVGLQLLRLFLRSRRPSAYRKLCQQLDLYPCEPEHGLALPELNETTEHIQGEHDGYQVHIFENATDTVVPGASTEAQTCIAIAKPGWNLPLFTIEPRSIATNLRQHVDKNKGLFFPRDELFTASCFVDGPDRKAVQSALTPEATQHLRGNRHVHMESRGGALLVYRSEELLSANQARRLLEQAVDFADGLGIPDGGTGTRHRADPGS
jgi:hypothetical protein